VRKEIQVHKEAIQCVVSKLKIEGAIPLGTAQQPNVWDYADGIDTLSFLENL
jgi:hypothetical protein